MPVGSRQWAVGRRRVIGSLYFLLTAHCLLPPVFAEEPSAFSQAAAAYNDRDLDAALRYAEAAVRENPEHVDACVLLGELYYLRQDMKRARQSWEKAAGLAPNRQDVGQALKKLEMEYPLEKNLARSDTHPFVVRFAEGQMPLDLGDLRQMLRDAHRQIGQSLGYFPDHPITVLITPQADFEKVRGVSHSVAGLYDGKIRIPAISHKLYNDEARDGAVSPKAYSLQLKAYSSILWHEYTHALVHDLSKGACPVWLNEGIATAQEARVRAPNLDEAAQAFPQGKLPAWDQLWAQGYDPATLSLYYQTSYLVVEFLVHRWGWRGLARLLKRLGQGYPIQDALKAQYGKEQQTLEKEWRSWLRRKL